MDSDVAVITAIATAFSVIIGAVFTAFLKLLREIRKILNGQSEKRATTAATRHLETMAQMKTMTSGLQGLKDTVANHSSEQVDLLREIADGLQAE